MRISHKIQFIYFIIFILFLSLSKQIVNTNFDKPNTNDLHNNFDIYIKGLKTDFNQKNGLRNSSSVICEEITEGNLNRHSLRWIFEKLRIFYLRNQMQFLIQNLKSLFVFNNDIYFFFISYYLTNKIINKNNKIKTDIIILNFIFYIFLISLFLFRPIGELRFSIFELFFVTLSFYFAFNKKYYPYLLSVILCTLNRESGLICSIYWFVLNNNF